MLYTARILVRSAVYWCVLLQTRLGCSDIDWRTFCQVSTEIQCRL